MAFVMDPDLSSSSFHPSLMASSLLGISNQGRVNMESQKQRSCVDCHTTRTPLWRGGPAGPRSLCNACGIRYRKKTSGAVNKNGKGKKGGGSLKLRVVGFGREIVLHRATAMGDRVAEEMGGEFGEEEQAAMLLMALSAGYVYV